MNVIRLQVIRGAAILFVLFAGWRVLVLGLSEYYVTQALEDDVAAIDKALSWNDSHPKALYLKALPLVGSDPERAEELLRASLRHNPADARPVVILAQIISEKGELDKADALMEEATRLMPAHQWVQLKAAEYWIGRNHLDRALENWRAALITKPGLSRDIFPLLLKLTENSDGRGFLRPFTEDPPVWWDRFFSYLTQKAIKLETVTAVVSLRRASDIPLSEIERRDYVRRLIKEGYWPEAYLAWVNGLEKKLLRHLGGIYNGGFELEMDGEGFDWHVPKMQGVDVGRQQTYGIAGEKALHMTFKGREVRFAHLYQRLFLTPGGHQFRGQFRADRLQGRGGLQWVVRCADDPSILLGEGNRMLGTGEWQQILFEFTVPESRECSGQILRLESTGRTAYDHKLEGEIWFDRFAIRSI